MNILHSECSLNWGGQELRTLIECLWLNENGHRAWIMCDPRSELFKYCQQQKIDIAVPIPFRRVWRMDSWFRVLWFTLFHRVDIVNSHGSRDATICLLVRLFGVPLLRSRQITNTIKKKFSYRYGCNHIIAAAAVIKKQLIDKGIAAKKITVIGEGVDSDEYRPRHKPQSLIEEFGIRSDERVIVNIGMLRKDKGQHYFVKAAHELISRGYKLRFFIVGDAAADQETKIQLKKLIESLGLVENCLMVGYRNDVSDFINLADIVVVASIGTEAQSRIVPQAFASRVAVVSTNVGGLTELVEDQTNGLVVPPADSGAMADAIKRLLSDSELASSLAVNGYKLATEKLTLTSMMNKTIATYERFCREK